MPNLPGKSGVGLNTAVKQAITDFKYSFSNKLIANSMIWLVIVGLALSVSIRACADASVCELEHCGLYADGTYPNLVIGTLTHIGTDEEMQQVFHWAKSHGFWKALPDSVDPYRRDLKLVTQTLPPDQGGKTITLIMQREEYKAAPYAVGDLVRYAPHDHAHEAARGGADDIALFHGLSGCVATLCRKGDPACAQPYTQGVFDAARGTPINIATGKSTPGHRIDPTSLLPVH